MGSGISDVAGDVGSLQKLFGKRDPNATNDVMNGQIVATGTPGAQTVKDPNQGLSAGQRIARGMLSGGAQGLSQYGQNQGRPQAQINFAPAQRYSPLTGYTGNPFFGQQ